MQPISDTFIMNCKWQIEQHVCDIECLPNGEIIVASWFYPQIILFSVSGKQRAALQLESKPSQIVVVDKTTVAVFLLINDLAIVDIQQNHVQYIRNNAIPNISDTLIYIENEFYISNKNGIVVIDMSGSVKRRITLSFTPCDMGYDVDSQHIYCIVSEHSQLVCIDRDGNDIFTFTNPNMTNLTIDNEGNVLVLCKKKYNPSGHVIKVDSNGEKREVLITNINPSRIVDPRICYDHSTNSVVIGLDDTVYFYKRKA
ncbi:unnamed protein product [Mytilus edulis]|uniref:Uncharacterized protein n=1 Tax=Mytilus edulis TaxID=6550 RepID=A0A8S3SC37_MYTED|nr:unnamed protein product [Mytilus edulis]